MKCPYQTKEVIKNNEKSTLFADCCYGECPFYLRVNGQSRCLKAEAEAKKVFE